jgi:hypothetical protein
VLQKDLKYDKKYTAIQPQVLKETVTHYMECECFIIYAHWNRPTDPVVWEWGPTHTQYNLSIALSNWIMFFCQKAVFWTWE